MGVTEKIRAPIRSRSAPVLFLFGSAKTHKSAVEVQLSTLLMRRDWYEQYREELVNCTLQCHAVASVGDTRPARNGADKARRRHRAGPGDPGTIMCS